MRSVLANVVPDPNVPSRKALARRVTWNMVAFAGASCRVCGTDPALAAAPIHPPALLTSSEASAERHSTVTVFARFRGWSTSVPFRSAM